MDDKAEVEANSPAIVLISGNTKVNGTERKFVDVEMQHRKSQQKKLNHCDNNPCSNTLVFRSRRLFEETGFLLIRKRFFFCIFVL